MTALAYAFGAAALGVVIAEKTASGEVNYSRAKEAAKRWKSESNHKAIGKITDCRSTKR